MICIKLCTLLVLSSVIGCNALLQPLAKQTEAKESLRQCVDEIIKQFTSNDITTIVYSFPASDFELDYLGQFLSSNEGEPNNFTTVINDLNTGNSVYYFGQFKHPIGFVIILETLEELNTTLVDLEMEYDTNRFLIVFKFPFQNSRKDISNIMKSFLNKHKVNIKIIIPLSSNPTRFVIYYWNQVCGQRRLNIISYCSIGTFYNKTKLPYTRGPLDKCFVKAAFYNRVPYAGVLLNNQTGIELRLMQTISSVLHLTVNYLQLPYVGDVYLNGTTTGGFDLLKKGYIDIFFCGLSQTIERSLHFRSTSHYLHKEIIWCAPYVSYYNYDNFKYILNLPYLICIIVMLLTTSLVMWCMSNQSNEVEPYKKISHTFLNNWSILTGVAVYTLPKTSRVRLLITLFCVTTIVLNTFNSSYLTSLITAARYETKYDDINEVFKDNLKIHGSKSTKTYFQTCLSTSRNDINEKIYNKFEASNSVTACMDSIILNNSVCILSKLTSRFLLINSHEKLASSVHCSQNAIFKSQLGIYVRKGFSHLEEVNRIVARIFDAGLSLKWLRDLIDHQKLHVVPSNQAMIKMEHLLPVFKIYLIINSLAMLVFLAELYIGRKAQ